MGKYTIIAKAEFFLQSQAKPVYYLPYKTNPRAQKGIDKCVESMESNCTIEQSPSDWGSPVCIVVNVDGPPHFCIDCSNAIRKSTAHETWSTPDISYQYSRWRKTRYCLRRTERLLEITNSRKGHHKTILVTLNGKYVLKALPSVVVNAPRVFQHVMSLTFANFGQRSDWLVNIDNVTVCSATWEAQHKLVEICSPSTSSSTFDIKAIQIQF